MGFYQDLKYGESLEYAVLDYLGEGWRKVEGKHAEYDLINDGTGETIECKFDRRAMRTGNFCFEKTWLGKTTANKLWYSIDGSDVHYIFEVDAVQEFIKKATKEQVIVKYGGDQNHALYLMRVEDAELIEHDEVIISKELDI